MASYWADNYWAPNYWEPDYWSDYTLEPGLDAYELLVAGSTVTGDVWTMLNNLKSGNGIGQVVEALEGFVYIDELEGTVVEEELSGTVVEENLSGEVITIDLQGAVEVDEMEGEV